MTTPDLPPTRPTRPTRPIRPTPRISAAVPAPDLGWWARWRALAEQFDEQRLLADLEAADRQQVRRQVQVESASSVMALGWLAVPIFILLMRMDLLRIADGLLEGNDVPAWSYRLLLVAHAMVGVAAIPAFLVGRARRRDPAAAAVTLQAIHVSLILTAAMTMSVLGLLSRGSTYGFVVAMITANLIYHLPHRGRWVFNAIAVSIAGLLSLGVDHLLLGTAPLSPLADVTRIVEIVIILLLTILSGSVVRRQRVRSIIVEQRLSRLALVDGLTGVASRRRTEEVLAAELSVAGPARPLAVVMVDLDDFKTVNDTFGHNAGDDVLRGVARLLQQRGRLSDTVGRWGGEEFVLVCPDTPVTGALGLAEQLRERLARQEFVGVGKRTASFGVAEARTGETVASLIGRADAAMYEAKRAGRNRVREA